jgi:hypothetical protein
MRTLTKRIVLLMGLVLLMNANVVWAPDPGDSLATCNISVTVSTIMEWAGNFAAIDLGAITSASDAPEGSETQTLYTNCNLEIIADNTISARLTSTTDSLVTKYKLSYDGDGSTETGGTDVLIWTDYSTFLSPASAVTHVAADGAADVTLYVQATTGSMVRDQGAYSAIQTLTASWTSD